MTFCEFFPPTKAGGFCPQLPPEPQTEEHHRDLLAQGPFGVTSPQGMQCSIASRTNHNLVGLRVCVLTDPAALGRGGARGEPGGPGTREHKLGRSSTGLGDLGASRFCRVQGVIQTGFLWGVVT